MYKRSPIERRVFLRGTTWWLWAYDNTGKRYRTSTHQTDRKAALEAARKIERERSASASDQAESQAQACTLRQALSLLLAHDKRVDAKPATIEFHTNRARHLVRVLGADHLIEPNTLTRAVINSYIDARLAEGNSTIQERHTIQKEVRVLLQALALAKDEGHYFGDPRMLRPKAFKKARSFYDPSGSAWLEEPEYIDALVAATSAGEGKHQIDRKLDILAFLNLGVRRNELPLIGMKHVRLKERLVEIDGTKTDGSKRILPLNDTMVEVFRRKLKHAMVGDRLFRPWGSGNRDLKANWRRARAKLIDTAKRAGDKSKAAYLQATLPHKLTFNDLRRTFCSLMAKAGVPLHHCADLLGHKDLQMVQAVYRKVSPSSLHAAVNQLPATHVPADASRPQGPSRRERQRRRATKKAGNKALSSGGAVTVLVTNGRPKSTPDGAK